MVDINTIIIILGPFRGSNGSYYFNELLIDENISVAGWMLRRSVVFPASPRTKKQLLREVVGVGINRNCY